MLRGAKQHTGMARRRDKRHGILGVWADHLPAAASARRRSSSNVVGPPRIYQAANGVWPTDRMRPRLPVGLWSG